MTKLGIIGAMQVEVEILLGRMENQTSRTVAGSEFHEGTLEGLPAVVVGLRHYMPSSTKPNCK